MRFFWSLKNDTSNEPEWGLLCFPLAGSQKHSYHRLAYTDMPHIDLPDGVPGILAPMQKHPEMARHLTGLAQSLLRGPSSLTSGERELIAAYTSAQNECEFCTGSHSATARHLLGESPEVVDQVLEDGIEEADLGEKMKALLCIADKVQRDARGVSEEDVERARKHGADDKAIHDTVLTAAAFCMYNRYVDGLDTPTPEDEAAYDEHGKDLATNGYTSVVE